jgi:hypothetical protein
MEIENLEVHPARNATDLCVMATPLSRQRRCVAKKSICLILALSSSQLVPRQDELPRKHRKMTLLSKGCESKHRCGNRRRWFCAGVSQQQKLRHIASEVSWKERLPAFASLGTMLATRQN